jgi:hypothetical protein
VLRHLIIPSLHRHDCQRHERFVVSWVHVECLVERGLSAVEVASRLVQHAHQEKDRRGGAGGLLLPTACLHCLGVAADVGQFVRFVKQFVPRRRFWFDCLVCD